MAKLTNLSKAPRKVAVIGESGEVGSTLIQPGEFYEGKVVETKLLQAKIDSGAFKLTGDLSKAPDSTPAPVAPKVPPVGGAATGQK